LQKKKKKKKRKQHSSKLKRRGKNTKKNQIGRGDNCISKIESYYSLRKVGLGRKAKKKVGSRFYIVEKEGEGVVREKITNLSGGIENQPWCDRPVTKIVNFRVGGRRGTRGEGRSLSWY